MMKKILSTEQKVDMANVITHCETKSASIRALDAEGYKRGDIARFLKIRYQHVRNVLVNPPKNK